MQASFSKYELHEIQVEQIHMIFKLCGAPTEDYWKKYDFLCFTFHLYDFNFFFFLQKYGLVTNVVAKVVANVILVA